MRQGGTRDLLAYWNRIRADRPAPAREEIEPSDIRHLLADTFILDVSRAYRTVSYRLAGTRLCAAHGRELKGLGFLVPFAEEHSYRILQTLSRVYDGMSPQLLVLGARTADDRDIEFEMLLLPLKPVADGSCRVLGICTPMETPFWLGASPLIHWQINTSRTVTPEHDLPQLGEVPPLAPHLESGQEQAPISRRTVRHLVVHQGGRDD